MHIHILWTGLDATVFQKMWQHLLKLKTQIFFNATLQLLRLPSAKHNIKAPKDIWTIATQHC